MAAVRITPEIRDDVHCCENHSVGIHAASLPHFSIFIYKNVAFFFGVSLELAHQASHSCSCIISSIVSDDLGVQQQSRMHLIKTTRKEMNDGSEEKSQEEKSS